MLTYQVRPRVFRIEDGQTLPFPSDGEVRFYFQPLQPFGLEAGRRAGQPFAPSKHQSYSMQILAPTRSNRCRLWTAWT